MTNTNESKVAFGRRATLKDSVMSADSSDFIAKSDRIVVRRVTSTQNEKKITYSSINFDDMKKKEAYRKINDQLREG